MMSFFGWVYGFGFASFWGFGFECCFVVLFWIAAIWQLGCTWRFRGFWFCVVGVIYISRDACLLFDLMILM